MATIKTFAIAGRTIGDPDTCFIIAEAGVNHNGDLELAKKLVTAAHEASADAIKFQTFTPERLVAENAPVADYQKKTGSRSQAELLASLVLSPEAHRVLSAQARSLGIIFLSSPFDEASGDFLDQLGIPAFKIGSGELTNHRLLAHLASKRKPLLLSTGMSTLAEVEAAVTVIKNAGNPPVALFHCVSNYPADARDANLRAIDTLQNHFSVPIGWSDHTPGTHVALAAVARCAVLIEKHLTIDRTLPGPDHAASLEPAEFAAMVTGIRQVCSALGNGEKRPVPAEAAVARVARKSLHYATSLAAGSTLQASDLVALRPATGISPVHLNDFVGRRLKTAAIAGTPISEEDFE